MARHMRSNSSGPTVKPPPPLDDTVSPVENAISLTPLTELGPHIFTNTRPSWQPMGARGVYGGSVIAQSLLAAQLTLPPNFVPHSMHCFFVLGGNPHIPIVYNVDIVREGRSYHTRTVVARQRGKPIFTAMCSFTLPLSVKDADDETYERKVVRHQPVFPIATARGPDECESELQAIERLLGQGKIDEETAEFGRARYERDPFEWRSAGIIARHDELKHLPPSGPLSPDVPAAERCVRQWVRSKAPIRDPTFAAPAMAYFSDSWFLGTVGRVNPAGRRDKIGMMVSLDHTIHFHAAEKLKLDEWMLVETESPWAAEERGLVRMKIWAQDGTLLASCLQEGMVRLKDGRQGEALEQDVGTPKSKL